MARSKSLTCPLCSKGVSDILKHFSIAHEIANMEQLRGELERADTKQTRKKEFRKYVEALKEKEAKGLISSDDYRRLIMEWDKQA